MRRSLVLPLGDDSWREKTNINQNKLTSSFRKNKYSKLSKGPFWKVLLSFSYLRKHFYRDSASANFLLCRGEACDLKFVVVPATTFPNSSSKQIILFKGSFASAWKRTVTVELRKARSEKLDIIKEFMKVHEVRMRWFALSYMVLVCPPVIQLCVCVFFFFFVLRWCTMRCTPDWHRLVKSYLMPFWRLRSKHKTSLFLVELEASQMSQFFGLHLSLPTEHCRKTENKSAESVQWVDTSPGRPTTNNMMPNQMLVAIVASDPWVWSSTLLAWRTSWWLLGYTWNIAQIQQLWQSWPICLRYVKNLRVDLKIFE